jgi:hypothetical protein
MIYKYRYIGTGEVHLPKFGITIKEGDVFELKEPIENPDFEFIPGQTEPEKEAVKPNKKK